MKKITIMLLSIFLLGGISSAIAGRDNHGKWTQQKKLSSEEDFAFLEEGDKIALICMNCDSIFLSEIDSLDQAMEYCKEGSSIDCPSCKNVAKIKHRAGHGNSPNPPRARHQVVYVDDHGEACFVMAKLD